MVTVKKEKDAAVRFASVRENMDIFEIHTPYSAGDVILGTMENDEERFIVLKREEFKHKNENIFVLAPSGSGKVNCFIKPSILQYIRKGQSVIINDIDGELYNDTADYFKEQGYDVRCLNLKNLDTSDSWNMFGTLFGVDVEDDVDLLVSALILGSDKDDKQSLEFIMGCLLKALILKVVLSPAYADNKRTLASVYKILSNQNGEEYFDKLFSPNRLTLEDQVSLSPYMIFKSANPSVRNNTILVLREKLKLLSNEKFLNIFCKNGIELTKPAMKPCAYFCIYPDSHELFQPFISAFYTMLISRLCEYADNECYMGRADTTVRFIFNNFPAIGPIPDFEKRLLTTWHRDVNFAFIVPSISQLAEVYPNSWPTIASAAKVCLVLGAWDRQTAEYVYSRISSWATIEIKGRFNTKEIELICEQLNVITKEKRELISVDEIMNLDNDSEIILVDNRNPILADKFKLENHLEANKVCPSRD